MARYSRESRLRAVKEGNRPPLMCPNCGQNFWNVEQQRAHIGVSAGKSYCQYAPAVPKPASV